MDESGPVGRYGVVSIFSGALGLDLGLERAGRFKLLGCVESSAVACETIRANRDAGLVGHPSMPIYNRNIRELEPTDLLLDLALRGDELDLLAGGPPCQAYSTAGRRRSVQDPRGLLVWDFIRFVAGMRPRAFLFENVRGFLSAATRLRPLPDRPENGGPALAADEEPGSVVRAFIRDLPGDYRVDIFVVNAANYGVAQSRERVFIIGNRYNRATCFPGPTHGDGPGLLPFGTVQAALSGLVEDHPVMLDFSPERKRHLALVPPGGDWRDLPEEIAQKVVPKSRGGKTGFMRRLSWDEPAPTILCNPNQTATAMCHPVETRALTARECARIQGFPDEWRFEGGRSAVYRQIGNAVPVGLAEVCGLVAASLLDAIHMRGHAEVEQGRSHVMNLHSRVRVGGRQRAG